jgi:hypothetical protein
MRVPEPGGTAVYVSSCPATLALAASDAAVSVSPVRSLWNVLDPL